MILPQDLADKGFALFDVTKQADLIDYLFIKKCCYKNYVDEYYGGWFDDAAIKRSLEEFEKAMMQSCFKKIVLRNRTVGFFAFDEKENCIDGVSIQILEEAQGQGIGSFYLSHIVALANERNVPAFLQVFKANPAQKLYKRFGFEMRGETEPHYLMEYRAAALHAR